MCCDSWGHKESDTTEQLNRTELKEKLKKKKNRKVVHLIICRINKHYFNIMSNIECLVISIYHI